MRTQAPGLSPKGPEGAPYNVCAGPPSGKSPSMWQLLDQLDKAEGAAFVEDYRPRVRKAYPPQDDGRTILPFKQLSMVAVK